MGLVARDLDRMIDFYCDVLGMKVADTLTMPADSPYSRAAWLRLGTDHHVLSMFELEDAGLPTEDPRGPGRSLHHFAFEMHTFEELREAARTVRERDIPLHGMRTGGPGWQLRLYIWDPEDNQIELYWGLDQIGWDGKSRPFPALTSIDLESFDVDAWLELKGQEFARDGAPLGSGAK